MAVQKILVVDDEARMRKLVSDFLAREGFEVLEAGDGEKAMDLFYGNKDIALILLDVMMPKMDGWQVLREIRESSQVPVIMLTARADEKDCSALNWGWTSMSPSLSVPALWLPESTRSFEEPAGKKKMTGSS